MEQRFLNLFCLAMDVLPAQASLVPCECLFSSAKETFTAHRNRIQPDLMGALQVLKISSRNSSPNFIKHLSAGLEDDFKMCEEPVCESGWYLIHIHDSAINPMSTIPLQRCDHRHPTRVVLHVALEFYFFTVG